MGQPKAAMEPAMYVGVPKACTFCNSTDVRFKFLNNGKMEQPRYKCLGCKKLFTHNPASRRKKHPQGYSLVARSNAGATILPANAMVTCLNPRCGQVGASKFLFFNNGKLTQPRYKCGRCNTAYTCGGRLKPNRNLEAATQHVGQGGGQFMPSHINDNDGNAVGQGYGQFMPSTINDNDENADGEGNGQFMPSNINDNDENVVGEGNGQFLPSNKNNNDENAVFQAVHNGDWWQALVLDAAFDPEQNIGDRPLGPDWNCDGNPDVAQLVATEDLDNHEDLESHDMPDIMAFWNSVL